MNTAPQQNGLPQGDVPPLIYLARVLNLCIFPVLTVLLGVFMMLFVSQVREALLAIPGRKLQAVTFEIAFLAWMLSAWYVARLLVGRRFQPDLVGLCRSPGFARAVALWLPRVLALIAGVPVAGWVFRNHIEPPWLGPTLMVSWLVVLLAVVFRRPVAAYLGRGWLEDWIRRPDEQLERFESIPTPGWALILFLVFLSAGLWIALPAGMEYVARPVGSPALLLLALMSWTIFGGFMLTYLPKRHGWPALTWVPLLAAVCFYPLNEGHLVTAPAPSAQTPRRVFLEEEFRQWLKERRDRTAPVIFVATAGGASRAAFWTSSSLGMLEDEARNSQKVFAGNMFVISGVSGGSLGAATFVAALDQARHAADLKSPCGSVRELGERFNARDDLSSVLGMLLFPDLLQKFLPLRLRWWDRSRGLEEVWARDWEWLIRSGCAPGARQLNPWQQPFAQLHARGGTGGGDWLPALALNTAALGSGRQVLQADFQLARTDAFDLFDPHFAVGPITLAQAVHNSARFPYVSPGGVVRVAGDRPGEDGGVWDRIGDGGYVEASGARMLTEIIGELRQAQLIRVPAAAEGAAADAAAVARGEYITMSQVRVLVLESSATPSAAREVAMVTEQRKELFGLALDSGWLCDRSAVAGHGPWEVPQNPVVPARWWDLPIPEAVAPVNGAFSTRDGRKVSALLDLLRVAGGCTTRFAELRLPEPKDPKDAPSMSWMLSPRSQMQMHKALDLAPVSEEESAALLRANLETVRSWFVTDPAAGATPSAVESQEK
jgi:hypothetical protein